MPTRKTQGFTLVELMIVISIIGVLAGILIPVLMRARFKSYHTACVQNERNIATALELYSIENDSLYPDQLTKLTEGDKPYIAHITECPSSGVSYLGSYSTQDGMRKYVLECPGQHDRQLVGLVEENFPRAVNGRVEPYRAP